MTTTRPTQEPPPSMRSALRGLLRQRSVQITAIAWVACVAAVLALADGDTLPFDWPGHSGENANKVADRITAVHISLAEVLILIWVVWLLTRSRPPLDLAGRAPGRAVAARETAWLLGYGVVALGGGYLLAKAAGWHPFGLHLAGTLYGTGEHVTAGEALAWAGYNVVVWAVLPLAWFRRRYTATQLNLRSSNRRGDTTVIVVVLAIEAAVQTTALLAFDPQTFDLSARQWSLGLPLTFGLYMAGAVLPAMVFIYAILVPRLMRLTGSAATTVICGGLLYTAVHLWDVWTVWDSPRTAALSVIFLLGTYFAPGMIKTWLTVRTGNAWVHVWAYHALAPHTLIDTSHTVHIFQIKA